MSAASRSASPTSDTLLDAKFHFLRVVRLQVHVLGAHDSLLAIPMFSHDVLIRCSRYVWLAADGKSSGRLRAGCIVVVDFCLEQAELFVKLLYLSLHMLISCLLVQKQADF